MKVMAIAYDDNDNIVDAIYTWETAQSMALNEGYRIEVLSNDGHMSMRDIQQLCDAELERYRDCWY